ncbi:MAG: hypothetical protein CGU28_04865 [Candidatus Dactylopiibacterium carminicum]|uniref:Heparinase n=2 Tax=Candidatus Dactylopiibacterium carminicum TaxID=857335 RepID=A0A272EU87_9RHOO|nr:hypothetical protein BGI27_06495 [Candidatus Dactylopiibacterium carminicum]PAS93664.1 MAG: hypothetical protein CGU29_06935 [Candidatus Dactylopiibacterium carminicum]PAS97532.1 MAG: hypothetical protein CGU28_04865 [Candidatus Dactylopiibacterium carminicum]PAS99730.1 MAG: hypothetical protein BSR46_06530 [Candidatus Dactylopiibacterium carminicum]
MDAPPSPLARSPFDEIVTQHLLPQLDHFCARLLAERRDLQLDGELVFSGKDKFLPGKIAKGMSYLLLAQPVGSSAQARHLAAFGEIAQLTLEDANDSWGIYYYLSALNGLREAGLLTRALSAGQLAALADKLDWRHFVDAESFRLKELPTNYYGVAFSIARLRFLLGWEDSRASEILLDKTLEHYRTYSGEYGFSDETEGQGRFDRYSVLLVAEICQRFIETGLEVTEQLRIWLKRASDVVLGQLSVNGAGFSFGRSIGAYGDTAFVEILTTAAHLDLLTPAQLDLAYAACTTSAARYAEFWFDAETHSVNLWDRGRRTDTYRGKHRILGENLSLLHQLFYTARQWEALGFHGKPPMADFSAALAELPRHALTWFARGEHDRTLITCRDGTHVISLPLISGGSGYHSQNPYFSIPFADGLIQAAPDTGWPQLLPRLLLADGSELIPAAFQQDLQIEQQGEQLLVRFHQAALDRLGGTEPQADTRVRVSTTYRFAPGEITREDCFTPQEPLQGARLSIEFGSFSRLPQCEGCEVRFAEGLVNEIAFEGAEQLQVADISTDPDYHTPTGPLLTRVRAETGELPAAGPWRLRWHMRYRN